MGRAEGNTRLATRRCPSVGLGAGIDKKAGGKTVEQGPQPKRMRPSCELGCGEDRSAATPRKRWSIPPLERISSKEMRVDLKVPYSQKDEARKLGARWDRARKTWYVENEEHLGRFLRWVPDHLRKPHEAKHG